MQLGKMLDCRVQLRHIARMMLVMVQRHRARIDVRLERCHVIGQGRKHVLQRTPDAVVISPDPGNGAGPIA